MLTTITTETKIFRCHLSMGILAAQIFRCYSSMTILTIPILQSHTHSFRCHLRMEQKVLLLFKYEFFETLILSHSQEKVIILQLFLYRVRLSYLYTHSIKSYIMSVKIWTLHCVIWICCSICILKHKFKFILLLRFWMKSILVNPNCKLSFLTRLERLFKTEIHQSQNSELLMLSSWLSFGFWIQ